MVTRTRLHAAVRYKVVPRLGTRRPDPAQCILVARANPLCVVGCASTVVAASRLRSAAGSSLRRRRRACPAATANGYFVCMAPASLTSRGRASSIRSFARVFPCHTHLDDPRRILALIAATCGPACAAQGRRLEVLAPAANPPSRSCRRVETTRTRNQPPLASIRRALDGGAERIVLANGRWLTSWFIARAYRSTRRTLRSSDAARRIEWRSSRPESRIPSRSARIRRARREFDREPDQ